MLCKNKITVCPITYETKLNEFVVNTISTLTRIRHKAQEEKANTLFGVRSMC